jgi:SAM-dependent methyltransferase
VQTPVSGPSKKTSNNAVIRPDFDSHRGNGRGDALHSSKDWRMVTMEPKDSAINRTDDSQQIVFRCNICDQINDTRLELLSRDTPSCRECGSSVRLRSIIQVLTTELFGQSISISQIKPRHPELSGIGMSCWNGYATPLARLTGFRNTFYHQEPRLDITHIEGIDQKSLDFIISSDVFEHIEPPVDLAFDNVRKLLDDDGVFVFSAPFIAPGEKDVATLEHYPELFDFEIIQNDDTFVLKNTTKDGRIQHFDQLVFHGGPGTTLEMRLFSESSIISALVNAGFSDISIYRGSDLAHGIYWRDQCSIPIAARLGKKSKPNLSFDKDLFLRRNLLSRLKGKLRRMF